jgi:hypothetical protein
MLPLEEYRYFSEKYGLQANNVSGKAKNKPIKIRDVFFHNGVVSRIKQETCQAKSGKF